MSKKSEEATQGITLSMIDDKLSVYQNVDVYIWGASLGGKAMFEILSSLSVPITSFCDTGEDKWGQEFCGRKIVSPEMLKRANDEREILVQIGSDEAEETAVVQQLEAMGIHRYVSRSEAEWRLSMLQFKRACDMLDMSERVRIHRELDELHWSLGHERYYKHLTQRIGKEKHIVLMPGKTGHGSVHHLLREAKVPFASMDHQVRFWDDVLMSLDRDHTVKLITAVRDPIGQNLSWANQMVTAVRMLYSGIDEAWVNGGDMQSVFDVMLTAEGYMPSVDSRHEKSIQFLQGANTFKDGLIQFFVPSFCGRVVDIMSRPFDREKGYSIIKDENIEVFVYQIERLNDIKGDMLRWLGREDTGIKVERNVAAEKWSANSYQNAKKNIKLSQDYFEKCYNEPYVRHFYDDKAIEKMKNSWRKNIV